MMQVLKKLNFVGSIVGSVFNFATRDVHNTKVYSQQNIPSSHWRLSCGDYIELTLF